MRKYFTFILMIINSTFVFAQETNYEFGLRGNFGTTFTSISHQEETQNLEWLSNIKRLTHLHNMILNHEENLLRGKLMLKVLTL